MKDLFVLSDWTSLSQVKNSVDPSIKATASIRPDKSQTIITIFKCDSILVRVPVDSEGWSLTYQDALELLASYGFNCDYRPTFEISDHAVEVLRAALTSGVTTVKRVTKSYGYVEGYGGGFNASRPYDFRDTEGWKYEEWMFMTPNVCYSVKKLLEGVVKK